MATRRKKKPQPPPAQGEETGIGSPDNTGMNKTALPHPVPPRSVVRLIRSDKKTPAWQGREGTVYRVGYYSRQDGLEEIRLVDSEGQYIDIRDHECVLKYVEVISVSDETDLYGDKRPKLGPWHGQE
jgi:hypothetical protein